MPQSHISHPVGCQVDAVVAKMSDELVSDFSDPVCWSLLTDFSNVYKLLTILQCHYNYNRHYFVLPSIEILSYCYLLRFSDLFADEGTSVPKITHYILLPLPIRPCADETFFSKFIGHPNEATERSTR